MDLYVWCLNLFFIKIDLYLVPELIGKNALGPNGTQAQTGPGPNQAQAQMGPRPKWDPGPNATRAQIGPGPKWDPGSNWALTQNLCVVTFLERIGQGSKIDMAM